MKVLILRGGDARTRACNDGCDTADTGVAAFGSGGRWALVNVSSAVARQLDSDALRRAAPGLAEAGVRAVLLTDAQLEHAGGLLALRRGAPIELYATPVVFEELSTHLQVLPALQHYCGVQWRVVPVAGDRRVAEFRVDGLPALSFTAIARAQRPWPHAASQRAAVGDHVAIVVRDLDSGRNVYCAPGLSMPGDDDLAWMARSDCLLLGGGALRARPGAVAFDGLDRLPARHKLLLGCDAPGACGPAGFERARDGMEIEL